MTNASQSTRMTSARASGVSCDRAMKNLILIKMYLCAVFLNTVDVLVR